MPEHALHCLGPTVVLVVAVLPQCWHNACVLAASLVARLERVGFDRGARQIFRISDIDKLYAIVDVWRC